MFIVLQLSLAQHNYRKQLRYMLQLSPLAGEANNLKSQSQQEGI